MCATSLGVQSRARLASLAFSWRTHHLRRYTDELLTLRCAPALLQLQLFPNAKELTESFACFNAARAHLAEAFRPDDPSVLLLAIGDGLTPRTAALFAFRTSWRCVAVDPLMRAPESWGERIERLTAHRATVAAAAEAEPGGGFVAPRVLLVLPHAHVGLAGCLRLVRWQVALGAVVLPCCDWYGTISTAGCGAPMHEAEDPAIVSPHRLVRVWQWGSGECLPSAVRPPETACCEPAAPPAPAASASATTLRAGRTQACGPLFGDCEPSAAAREAEAALAVAAATLRRLLGSSSFASAALACRPAAQAGGPPTADEYSDWGEAAGDEALARLDEASRLLVLLYLVGRAVEEAAAAAALGEAALAELLGLGLLERHPAEPRLLVSPVQVYPLELDRAGRRGEERGPAPERLVVLLCTDWDVPRADTADGAAPHGEIDRRYAVMPIGVDSLQLALSLPPDRVRGLHVLDVCCGSGVQGLVAAARGAARVVATDLSPRAVRFTRFNAALNGLDLVLREVRTADCYAGLVQGETFDLILANPPFVATPERLVPRPALFSSGGEDGADVVRPLAEGAARHLAVGGVLLLIAQLPNIDQAHEWLLQPRQGGDPHEWLLQPRQGGDPLELLVVFDPRHTQSSRTYASERAAHSRAEARACVAALEAAGVRNLGFGLVIARRAPQLAGPAEPTGAAARGGSVPLSLEGGGASTAMLEGDALREMRALVARGLSPAEPLLPTTTPPPPPQTAAATTAATAATQFVEELVGMGGFGLGPK